MKSNHEDNRRTWKKLESRARHSSEKTRPVTATPATGATNLDASVNGPIDDQVKDRCQVEFHGKMKSWHESLREFICPTPDQKSPDQSEKAAPILNHDNDILAALDLNHNSDCAVDCDNDMNGLLDHFMALIQKSPMAQMLLDDLNDHGWTIALAHTENQAYIIDHDHRDIAVNHFDASANDISQSDDAYCQIFMNLLRAMREAWQDMRLHYPQNQYHPESILMIEKLRMADSDIVALICAQEIDRANQDASQDDLLFIDHMLKTDERAVAAYFQNQSVNHDGTAGRTNTAPHHKIMAAMAFQTWFKDARRVNMVEHDILTMMDDQLAHHQTGNAFGQSRIKALDVTRMGCLPDGTSYLAGIAEDIIHNPNFVGLNDPINQAHYFHIIRDMNAIMVGGVPFRSEKLAALIFPDA